MATSKYLKAAKENLAKKGYKKYNTSGGESKLKKDLSVVNGDYINSFIKDADSFIESSRASYDTAGYDTTSGIYEKYKKDASDLDERAKRIRAYTRVYGGNLDKEAVDNINKILSAWSESKVALSSAFEEKSSFISSVKDADEYDSAMREAGYMTKYGDMSRAEREKALNDLKVGRAEDGKSRGDDKALDSEIDFLEYYGIRQGYDTSAEYDEEIRALEGEIQAIKDLRAKDAEEMQNSSTVRDSRDSLRRQNIYATESEKVRELENKIGALTVGRDNAKKREELYAEYGKYTESPDFEEGSKYVSTAKNLSDEEIKALGYKKDKTGEWYKNVGLGGVEYYDPAGDMVYEYINADDAKQNDMMLAEKAEMYATGNVMYNEDVVKTSRYKSYGEMTEEEVKIYNYLYQNSPKDAKAYLDALSPTLDKRFDAKETQRLAEIGYNDSIAGSLISIGTNVEAGLFAPAKVTADLFGADGSKFDSSSRVTSALRQGAGQKWGEGLDFDIPLIQKNAGEFVYGSLMSIADMGVALGLGVAAGGSQQAASKITQFIMSSEAASSEIYSAHEEGLSGIEVAARGVLAGAIEAITEKFSIENLLSDPKGIVRGIIQQAITEGTEETSATLLNSAVDVIASEIFGHANEIESGIYKLMSEGLTSEEAEKQVLGDYLRDLGTDALAGALTGALMGAAKETPTAIVNGVDNAIERKTIKSDVNKISKAVSKQLASLGEEGDVELISRAIAKKTAGQKLSKAESEALSESKYADTVSSQLSPEAIKRGDKGTEWTKNIRTTKVNAEQYGSSSGKYTVTSKGGEYSISLPDADGTSTEIDLSEFDSGSIERRVIDLAEKQKMTPATAQKLLNDYNSQTDVDNYIEEADYVYSMGKAGIPAAEISNGAGLLTQSAREMLYADGAMYTEGVNRARDNAYRTLRERTEGSVTAGRFDTTSLKGMKLNATQKRNMRFAEGLSKLGFNIRLENEIKGNKRALGFYDEKTGDIVVNVNGSLKDLRTVRGQFLSTLSHELTHRMKNTAGSLYSEYRDVVLKGFTEAGKLDSMLTDEVVRLTKTGRYKNMSDGELLEVATDEIIARASENMLKDSDAIERLIAENRTLGEKILEFIGDVAERLKSILKEFEGEESLREEAQLLREMVDTYEEAKAKWSEAFAKSAENVSVANAAGVVGDQIVMTEDGEVVYEATSDGSIRFNEATYDEEGRDKLRVFLEKQIKNKQLSNEDAADILTSLEDIYDTIHKFRDKYAPYGEWAEAKVIRDGKGNPVFSVVTPNGEYAMNIDFSLVCKKRRMLDAVFNRMIKRGMVDDFALGQEEIVKINDIIKSHGFEIACSLCFVDAKRFRQAGVADSFVEIYNGIVNEITPEGVAVPYFNFGGNSKLSTEGDGLKNVKVDNSVFDRYVKEYGAKSVPGRVAKYLKAHPADRKLLSRGDFISTAGFDAVRTQKPDILKLFNAKKGSGGPKSAFSDTQYLNEIIERRAFNAAKAFLVGGVRVQSFSDYIPRLVFDYCQMIADLSAKKLPAHAYSKEALFVKQFGKTGIKINMSLIPKIVEGGVAPGLDANGNYAWADESFDFETAKKIQSADGYTDYCGTICVGVSREHILKLLDDPDIRMVIPYHKSGLNPIVAELNKIDTFKDYTYPQNTRYRNADGTAGSKLSKADLASQPNINELMQNGMDAKAAAQEYLKWCEENNYVPKFDQFKGHENYYKLLIDFVAYNKNGAAVPQGAVKMNFPKDGDAFGSMTSLIEEGLEADAVTQFAQNEALDPIVDEIEKVLGAEEVLYSEYDDYAPTFYSHMGKVVDDIKQAKLGANSVVSYLKGKGVKNEEIKWSGIEEFLEGKKSITKEELQQFVAGSQLQIEETVRDRSDNKNIKLKKLSKDSYAIYVDGKQVDTITKDENYEEDVNEKWWGEHPLDADDYYVDQYAALDAAEEKYGKKTRWDEYKLKGGKNYREITFTLPGSDYQNGSMVNHWGYDAKGVLAHARLQDFKVNGKKMLFVEEIQSDWHNEGHKVGYQGDDYSKQYEADRENYVKGELDKLYREGFYDTVNNNPDYFENEADRKFAESELTNYRKGWESQHPLETYGDNKTPDAPFRDNYHEFVLKRLIRMAAEGGYDSIGWTPAQMQSERWSDDYAEGYRIEYDQDIPKFLNKYGKKWGAKVGQTYLNAAENAAFIETQEELIEDWENELAETSNAQARNRLQERINRSLKKIEELRGEKVWSMPITDAMKDSVLHEGQPMYSEYDDTSMRETLAGALLETAQDDAERSAVEEYQSKAREYDSMQRELDGINHEIKQLSFAKGKRNTGRLSELRGQKAALEKKLQRADKRLLELEATKALKDVLLRREKQLRTQKADALKKARAEAKAATAAELERIVAEEREKAHAAKMGERMAAEAEIADIKRRAAEREIERRKASARNAVKERAKNLISYINNQTDKKNVKEGIKGAALEFMKMTLRDSGMFTPREMGNLRDAYEALRENTPESDLNYAGTYDFEIMDDIKSLSKNISGKAWRDLTLEELEAVNRVTSNLRTMIRTENRIFREGRAADRLALAEGELSDISNASKRRGGNNAIVKLIGTNNMTPWYFFKSLGGTMWKLFRDTVKGQNKAASEYDKARRVLDGLKDKYSFKDWYNTKAKEFTAVSGEKFKLTVGQMMYIYAANKREMGNVNTKSETNHLLGGGIFVEKTLETIKNNKGKDIKDINNKAVRLSEDLLGEIVGSLTAEQKAMADELVAYLSDDMSALGNEVSMQLYGIKKFHEKYYIPYSVYTGAVGKNSIDAPKAGKGSAEIETKLKHMGSTNPLVKNSSQPLLAEDIFDIWSDHIVEMINYNSFVMPIEAFESVMNFRDEDGTLIREKFRLKYGDNSLSYLQNFMRDLNGGVVRSEKTGTEKLMSYAKKNAIAASVSVWIQQPTSILRALAVIDPKYLLTVRGGDSSRDKLSAIWDEMKKYAPGVTVTKEMGRFDIGSGAAARDYIHSDRSIQGVKDKVAAIQEKSDDILGLPAEWGDRIAWIQIWRACKAEISDKQGLTGEALKEAAGARFTDVINQTQVYDSILVRSGNMRSTNPIAVMATAYKAEPTLTLNLLADAFRSKNAKTITRTASVFFLQTLVNSALVSLVYAGRDDDEEKTFGEKYAAQLTGKVIDELTLIGSIPYLADLANVFKGYSVTRMDMDLFSQIADAYNKAMKVDSSAEDWGDLTLSIAAIFGIPAKNIWRDLQIIPNIVRSAKGTTLKSLEYAMAEELSRGNTEKILNKAFGFSFSPATNYNGYMKALEDGDTKTAKEIETKITEYKVFKAQRKAEGNGDRFKRSEAEDDARSSLQSRLTNRYKSAYIAAYERKDTDEMARIKAILRRSGVYKKNISDICRGWVKDN